MGYTTEFTGEISITPPLNEMEKQYLIKFNNTRRMERGHGPYFVDGSGDMGQGNDRDIINFNSPPPEQPGLWCQWVPNEDGTAIMWDGGEKFYYSEEWMEYIINHFIGSNPLAPQRDENLSFFTPHTLNGTIKAEGEDEDDIWYLVVKNNAIKVFDEDEYENYINNKTLDDITEEKLDNITDLVMKMKS